MLAVNLYLKFQITNKMKTKLKYILYSLMFLNLHLTIYGCSDSPVSTTTTQKIYKARTERDFEDKNLKAEPGAVIVLNLEDKNSPLDPEWFDTDIIGIDIIPIRYSETAKHHFKIDEESDFEMSLISDSSKQVLFELTPQNTQIDVMVPAGDYLMIIESLENFGLDTIDEQTIFIQPDMEITGSANTDYDPEQLNTLISTKRCVNCNLVNANLSGARLNNADLTYADLSSANLRGADLSYANLERARLRYANLNFASLYNANLEYVNLENADLSYANLSRAVLRQANLQRANLRNVNLYYANLAHANLRHANLFRANLSYAIMGNADLSYANICSAILTGIIGEQTVRTNSQTQCWW